MSISALFSTSINCFKTSTACRHAALIVLIGGLFLLLRPPADPRVMYWLGLLFFGMLGISLAVHTWRLWLNVRYPVFRKVVRALRSSRWILDVPPSVQLLHVMAFCAGFAALIFMQVTQSDTGFELPALVIGACLALAALIDLASRIARLVRQAWAPTAGKLFTVIIGAALLAIGVSIAKHVIHDITGANPANFSEFLAVFTALLVPVLYVLVSLCLLILLATCQFFWFVDFYGCAPNRGAVHPAGARADQSQAGRHLAQTQTWKKTPPTWCKPVLGRLA